VPADPSNPENWSGQDKLSVVIESAALNEQALSEYCRQKGLFTEQIERWKEAAIAGNEISGRLSKTEYREFQQLKKQSRKTEKELRRKDEGTGRDCVLTDTGKKSLGHLGSRRGRMILSEERQMAIELIDEAVNAGARQHKACEVLEINTRTLRRWQKQLTEEQRFMNRRKESVAVREPANKLSEEERQQIVEICVVACGWIKKGHEFELWSNTGRQRLNINGVINIQNLDTVTRFDDSINVESTISLFQQIEKHYPKAKKLHFICDNARYYRSRKISEYLETSKIELCFLPPYSPSLNLIERYWKYFKKTLLYNRYHETFAEFKQACEDFLRMQKIMLWLLLWPHYFCNNRICKWIR